VGHLLKGKKHCVWQGEKNVEREDARRIHFKKGKERLEKGRNVWEKRKA